MLIFHFVGIAFYRANQFVLCVLLLLFILKPIFSYNYGILWNI